MVGILSWESNSMRSTGKSDGETIRGDGKGINVSRKSKPGVGHKFAIFSFFGTASRTNSFVAPVSSPIFLSSHTREKEKNSGGVKEKNMRLISISELLFFFISQPPLRQLRSLKNQKYLPFSSP